MQPATRSHTQEISFLLHNLFIIHPTPLSKYKVRIIMSRDDNNTSFRKVNQKYIFKITNYLALLKQRTCYLLLLEKSRKDGDEGQYAEIGRGEIKLSDIMEGQQIRDQSTINGVIYGTKSHNNTRIIGKYSYKVFKIDANSPHPSHKLAQPANKIPNKLSVSRQKAKQSSSLMQSSIQQQQRNLQSKIRQLTKSMNTINSYRQSEDEQQQPLSAHKIRPTQNSNLYQSEYYYKYNDSFAQQYMKSASNHKQLAVITIKNLRIDNRTKIRQQTLELIKAQQTKINLLTNNYSQMMMQKILMVFYQLIEERRLKKRVLQIYLPINLNKDNRSLAHQVFYIPRTSNKMLVEIYFLRDLSSKYRNLNGVILPSAAKSRLIELYDMDNLQKGIMTSQIQNCHGIESDQLKAYHRQSLVFDKIMRHHGNAGHFAKKIKMSPPQLTVQCPIRQIRTLDNNLKDTLYSVLHEDRKVRSLKRKRYTTSVDQSSGKLQILAPTISRYNRSQINSQHNLSIRSRKSTKFDSKSIRAFPTMVQSIVKREDIDRNGKDVKLRLYIQSAQCYIYEMNDKATKFLIKLAMNGRTQNKKLVVGQSHWYPLHVQFRQFAIKDFLSIELLVNKRNTVSYKRVGQSNIMMSEMQDSQHTYKFFVFRDSKEVGYVVFKFRMFKKDSDQRSESFYYQQDVERKSLLKSQLRDSAQKSRYDDLGDSIIIQTDTDKSLYVPDQKEDKLLEMSFYSKQMSFYSKQIEPPSTNKLHQISEKASQGKLSEVLQNEEYQNGEPLYRRF